MRYKRRGFRQSALFITALGTVDSGAMPDAVLEIRWDSDYSLVAKLRVSSLNTLRDVHSALLGALPSLQKKEFTYLFQGKPIFREFWGIFLAKDICPVLRIADCGFKIVSSSELRSDRTNKHFVLNSSLRKSHEEIRSAPNHSDYPKNSSVSPVSQNRSPVEHLESEMDHAEESQEDPMYLEKPRSFSEENKEVIRMVKALYNYTARSTDQLSFSKGDLMEIVMYRPKGKWWLAKLNEKKGWIPHNFVKAVESDRPTSPE